jgi:hypothetical protein
MVLERQIRDCTGEKVDLVFLSEIGLAGSKHTAASELIPKYYIQRFEGDLGQSEMTIIISQEHISKRGHNFRRSFFFRLNRVKTFQFDS